MYFPYLRGKQYELLALREMSSRLAHEGVTTPVIEPVRKLDPLANSPSALERCVTFCAESKLDTVVVLNPEVGELRSNRVVTQLANSVRELAQSGSLIVGLISRDGVNPELLVQDIRTLRLESCRVALIALQRPADPSLLAASMNELNVETIVVHESVRERYMREVSEGKNIVSLRDGFPEERRNIDYVDKPEAEFSDDYLYYKEDGLFGFSDYLTIGENYSDGGFTPRAVVIHWTFLRQDRTPIRIGHFASTTNDDSLDVAGKFVEAGQKLVRFLDTVQIEDTQASEQLRTYVDKGTYPGLGVIKKLSIQNHLQLMSRVLCLR